MPYWRMRTDFEEEKRERRQRRATRNRDRMESITKKYLAYFTEENPAKRAVLLREYTPPDLDDTAETDAGRGAGRLGADVKGRSGAGGRLGAGTPARGAAGMTAERGGRRTLPPAPSPMRGFGRSTRKPSDVLERARDSDDLGLDSLKRPGTRRSTGRATDSPATDE